MIEDIRFSPKYKIVYRNLYNGHRLERLKGQKSGRVRAWRNNEDAELMTVLGVVFDAIIKYNPEVVFLEKEKGREYYGIISKVRLSKSWQIKCNVGRNWIPESPETIFKRYLELKYGKNK